MNAGKKAVQKVAVSQKPVSVASDSKSSTGKTTGVKKSVKPATAPAKAAAAPAKPVAKSAATKAAASKAPPAVAKPAATAKPVAAPVKSVAAAKSATKTVAKSAATKPAASPVKAVASVKPVAKSATAKSAAKAATAPVKPAASPAKAVASVKPVAKPATAKSATAKSVNASRGEAHSFSPEYLVVMQKDPNWMHAFWDVNEQRVQNAVKGGGKLVLRLYDVSSDLTVRANKERVFRDIEIPSDARSWYIQNQNEGGSFHVVLGHVDGEGQFDAIVDSDQVRAFGAEGQSLGGQDDFFLRASLGGVSVSGFGSSAQVLPGVSSASFLFAPSSETFSSLSFSSQAFSSAAMLQGAGAAGYMVQKGKDFFLWVKTRLIVYGGTRPDAHLQVRGQPFPLNPDGTFSLEMDLPDSTQIIPVFATDHEGDFPTTIVPVVVKRTE